MTANKVVGYQNITIPGPAVSGAAYSFRTITFKAVNTTDEDQVFDLTEIHPLKLTGEEFDATAGTGKQRCNGNVRIRKMLNTAGDYDTEYWYYSTTTGDGTGWFVGSKTTTSKKVPAGTVFLKKGEGLLINCTLAGGMLLRLSGEVELVDTTFVVPGPATSGAAYSFSGNNTPVTIDINDIHPLKLTGEEFDATAGTGKQRCNGNIRIRKMLNTAGDYDTEYWYYSTTTGDGTGWFVGSKTTTSKKVVKDVVTFEPGEGILVNCTLAGGMLLKLKNPIEPVPAAE